MIKKPDNFNINKNNIFANDLLNREASIKELSTLVVLDEHNKQNQGSFVVSINGEWGSGKTTFIKLWQAYLEKKYKIESIYFSAWEEDFSKDPLIPLVSCIIAHVERINTDKEINELLNKCKESICKLARNTITNLAINHVKSSTLGLVDVSGNSEKENTAVYDDYKERKEILKNLKNYLNKIINSYNSDDKDESNKPTIIFIDELDRCRPLYAIEMLERIKHIFDIDNLVFVLSIDKDNLMKSIKSQYGDIDTENYLRRFIDFEFNLKNNNFNKFCNKLKESVELNYNSNNVLTKLFQEGYTLNYFGLIKKTCAYFKLSLRQLQQMFTELDSLFQRINNEKAYSRMHIFVSTFFIILKSHNDGLYKTFVGGNQESKENIILLINSMRISGDRGYIPHFLKAIVDVVGLSNQEYKKLCDEYKKGGDRSDCYEHMLCCQIESDRFLDGCLDEIIKTVIEELIS